MTAKKKKRSNLPHLALHVLIGAISYWGSAVRLCLIGFFGLVVFIMQVIALQGEPTNMSFLSAVLGEGQNFVYMSISFLLLEVGYVSIAREYSLSAMKDKVALIGSEILLGICYFLPYFAVVSDSFTHMTRFIFAAVLFILAIRIVLGMRRRKEGQK